MNSFYLNIFAALAVFATPIFSQSIPSEDRFQELFEAKAPLKEIITEIMTIDPQTNYRHFQTVQKHIQKKDKYAEYSKSLLAAGQKILDHMLHEINHNEKIPVVKFVNAAYSLANGNLNGDMEILSLVMELNQYVQKLFEEALEEAKKKVMDKFLGTIDEATKEEDPLLKKQDSKVQAVAEETEPPKKRTPQPKRTRSSSAAGGKSPRRSTTSKPDA